MVVFRAITKVAIDPMMILRPLPDLVAMMNRYNRLEVQVLERSFWRRRVLIRQYYHDSQRPEFNRLLGVMGRASIEGLASALKLKDRVIHYRVSEAKGNAFCEYELSYRTTPIYRYLFVAALLIVSGYIIVRYFYPVTISSKLLLLEFFSSFFR